MRAVRTGMLLRVQEQEDLRCDVKYVAGSGKEAKSSEYDHQ